MDTRSLTHFLKLAQCLSFTKAADELYISQPTLSREIKLLEQEFNIKLFNRRKTGLTLTPEATELIPVIRRYLQFGDILLQSAQKKSSGIAGTLTIGYSGMADARILSLILSELYQKHPEIEVNLTLATHSKLILMLREGQLDAALSIEEATCGLSDIRTFTLAKKKAYVVLPKGHPLTFERSVVPEQLANENLIISSYSESPFSVNAVVRLYAEHGIKIKIQSSNSDPQSINYLVQGGKGITFSLADKKIIEAQGLCAVEFSPSLYSAVTLATTEERLDRPLLQTFLSIALDAGAKYKE